MLINRLCGAAKFPGLALGVATVSLWPECASANVVFDFAGTCNLGCTGTATGVLTLTNAYVYGTDMSPDFVSFSFTSSDLSLDITSANSPVISGGLNSNGSLNSSVIEIAVPHDVFGVSEGRGRSGNLR